MSEERASEGCGAWYEIVTAYFVFSSSSINFAHRFLAVEGKYIPCKLHITSAALVKFFALLFTYLPPFISLD
jgi:hypothetical protein